MESLKIKSVILLSSLISLVFGAAAGAVSGLVFVNFGKDDQSVDEFVLNMDEPSFSYAWEKASPAVVSIIALQDLSKYYNQFFFDSFGQGGNNQETEGTELQEVSSGSAFIISSNGLAVTNKHVVSLEDAQYVAIMNDGTELEVEVLDRDPLNDIALLKLSGVDDLPAVEFADSDTLSVGDHVLAIGNAQGEYYNTTTAGIISATERSIVAGGFGTAVESLVGLLQTDAAINQGNSGGPLVNLAGQVVGMNTAIDVSAESIGFAIASNDINGVVKSYEEFGRIVRPYLGVRSIIINESRAKRNNLSVDYGAYVVSDPQAGLLAVMKDSPADKAGIQSDDIILSVNGKKINEDYDLSNAISEYFVGDKIILEILRDIETFQVEVTLEERVDGE